MSFASSALAWVAAGFDKAARAARRFGGRPAAGERAVAGFVGGAAAGAWGLPAGWGGDKYEQVRHYRQWTYVAVRSIAEAVARHSIQAAYVRPAGAAPPPGKRFLTRGQRLKSHAAVQPHEELEAVDSGHPFLRLLNDPNGPDVAYTFWYRTAVALELTGEAYWWKVRSGLGRAGPPVELWTFAPHWVTAVPGSDRLVDRYDVRPAGAGGGRVLSVAPEDMVVFRYPSPNSLLAGHSPLHAGAEWIDTAEAIDSARWYLFENGQWPGMSVELDPDVFGKGSVTDAEVNRFYAQFDERIKGKERAGKPIIFRPGMKPSQMTRSPVEMDYIASAEQLCQWQMALHGVPRTIAGLTEDVNYASSLTARANFLHQTIGPKLALIGQVVTEQLAREFDPNLVAFWPDLAPEDPDQVNRDLAADFAAGAITPNEWRQKRGREPYPHGGDDPLLPGGTMPVPWATGEPDPAFADGDPADDAFADGDPADDAFADGDPADDAFGDGGPAPAGGPAGGGDEYGPLGKAWVGAKHPRGQPDNAGQFGPGGGGAKPRAKPGAKPRAKPGAKPRAKPGAKPAPAPAAGGAAADPDAKGHVNGVLI